MENLTLVKDAIIQSGRNILEIEKERIGLREDMKDIKAELRAFLPKGWTEKAIKVFLNKGMKQSEADDFMQICDFLGIGYVCGTYIPSETEETPELAERKKQVKSKLERYQNLKHELDDLTVQVRQEYAIAKTKGISVPLLKKLVDFVLNPDKLRLYHENTPLLEAYTEVIPEIE